MFRKGFNSAKCKTALRLAVSRIKLLRNKKDIQLKQMRREVAQLLQSGQGPSARIRVEHVIRDQNIMAAYEIIVLFCELLVARLPIIDSQKRCPIDLREAVSSLIFAAPRCADIPELLDIRSHFGSKYGKEFVAAAAELRPDCGVNRMIIEKLSVRAPSGETKLKIMKEIANEHQVEWDMAESEAEILKPHEDLLDGPSKFVGATNMHTESGKDAFHPVSSQKHKPDTQSFHQNARRMATDSATSASESASSSRAPPLPKSPVSAISATLSVEDFQDESGNDSGSFVANGNVKREHHPQATSDVKSMDPVDLHKKAFGISSHSLSASESNTFAPENMSVGKYDSSRQSDFHRMETKNKYLIGEPAASSIISNEIASWNSGEWNMNFKDAASAAQAAAHSAEKASEAARVAANLSKQDRFLNKGSTQAANASFGSSSADGHASNLNDSRTNRKPHSNDFLQNETQAEIGKPHQNARWQSSRQKGTEDIGDECELPMKSTTGLGTCQQPSNRVSQDNPPSMQKSPHVKRDEEDHFESVGGLHIQDSDASKYVDESLPWKRETMDPYSNVQPLHIFYDSVSINDESGKKVQMKRYKDSRSDVSAPQFDDYSHGTRSDVKHNLQNTEISSVLESNSTAEAYNQLSHSSSALQPPRRSPPGSSLSYQAKSQSPFSNNNNNLLKSHSAQAGYASSSLSSTDEEMNNLNGSTMRKKPSSNVLRQNERQPFDGYDCSGRHLIEANAVNGESNQNENWQKETGDMDNQNEMPTKRTSRIYPYHQPSNRVYRNVNAHVAEKYENTRGKEKHNFASGVGLNMKGTNVNRESLPRRELAHSNTRAQPTSIIDDSDSMDSESDEEVQLKGYEDIHRSKVNKPPHFDDYSHGSYSNFNSSSAKSTEIVSALKSGLVSEANNELYQSSPAILPHKGFPAGVSVSSEASSQSSLRIGESTVPREGSLERISHVHPKLPDYDDLAARFESMKTYRR